MKFVLGLGFLALANADIFWTTTDGDAATASCDTEGVIHAAMCGLPAPVTGCTNPSYVEYDETATIDAGCYTLIVEGCMDATACNYDETATEDDGSCFYSSAYRYCNGNCLNDIDEDDVCDEVDPCPTGPLVQCDSYERDGTTYTESQALANVSGCQELIIHHSDTEERTVCGSGVLTWYLQDHVYNTSNQTTLTTNLPVVQNNYGCDRTLTLTAGTMDACGVCNGDGSSCAGCTDDRYGEYNASATVNDGSCATLRCDVEEVTGTGCLTHNQNTNVVSFGDVPEADCNFNSGFWAGQKRKWCVAAVEGCMDDTACNYNSAATVDWFASCINPSEGQCCSGETDGTGEVKQKDACGVCNGDGSSCAGCTDPQATNYDADANTDDGSCMYTVSGCTDPLAENYDATATEDDESCMYTVSGCPTDTTGLTPAQYINAQCCKC
jgi:hypothetical protein